MVKERYTTDGSTPTQYSTYYTGPIFVDKNTTIKARTIKNGVMSPVIVGTYTIINK